jgi:predicted DNA-binding transcriptional regulator AlpA
MDTTRPLNADEVAERLGLTVHQVYRRLQRGDIPSVLGGRQNKQYLVEPDALQAYIDAGQPLSEPARDHTTLSVPEVAMATGLSCDAVRRMCLHGQLAAHRGDSRAAQWRIFKYSVDEFLLSRTAA